MALSAGKIDYIRMFLHGRHICAGIGTHESSCSMAAINLALSGHLTDSIPDCMSKVIGRWIINIQDPMPDAMRNSDAWRSLLPLAAGTGRGNEWARLQIVMDWLWGSVLPRLQPLADEHGFGALWRKLVPDNVEALADVERALVHFANSYIESAIGFTAVDVAADTHDAAANIAYAKRADAVNASSAKTSYLADAVVCASRAARAVAYTVDKEEFWTAVDPPALLKRLIECTGEGESCPS